MGSSLKKIAALLALGLVIQGLSQPEGCPYEQLGGTLSRTTADLERVDRVKQLFEKASEKFGETPQAMVEVFKSETLVPKDGVIHVVGPNLDFYEWLVPILARKDVTVIVSEPSETLELNVNERGQLTRSFWSHLKKYNPKLLEENGYGGEKGPAKLQAAVDAQVRFISSVTQTEFKDKTPIPKGDLVLARAPQHGAWNYGTQTKPGTLVWTVTEPFNAPTGVAPTQGLLPSFLPSEQDFAEPNRFMGMSLHFKPYFFIAGPSASPGESPK